ncbi:PLP-dependent aminotransferase family protein [Sinorhizobium americanum]|uniref:Transcriptional regulator, GntR n=1 Tax=Sinorhizobium americanum TaxID=194963 RepID=A0A1L3LWI5_9HYPH|nr:PLP-dependent aminotransferase family protein [Sinorhizobium americanum]APG94383.1 transcriptional regulator, GntR [Sinorhizobium americanum]OAP44462.1 hypothetical protein ATC00_20370 [Sinorhizobium americanum]
MTKYQTIAGQIGEAIRSGILEPGTRIPSVRAVAGQHSVSTTTALEALRSLEGEGLIEARPRSGYFVLNRAGSVAAAPRFQFDSELEEDARVHLSIVGSPCRVRFDLATGDPGLYPLDRFGRLVRRASYRSPLLLGALARGTGHAAFKQQIVRSALDHGCRISPEEIIVTNGCIEALNLSLRAVTSHGDRVAVESPCYFVLLQMLRALGLVAVPIPCDPLRGMDLAVLAEVLQTTRIAAVVSVANGNNPVGSVADDEDKAALVAMLADRKIPLIEDDMFGDVCFAPSRPPALRSFDRQGGVLWCGGLSKTLMPSLRLGWVAAGRFTAQVQALKYTSTMATSELFQVAAAELMENGGYTRHLKRLRQRLARQHAELRQAVVRHFPLGTEVSHAEGGYVAWVRLPEAEGHPVSTRQLFTRAREAGIGFVPGYLFGGREFDDCLRLNAGYPWSREQEEAIAHLGQLVKQRQ